MKVPVFQLLTASLHQAMMKTSLSTYKWRVQTWGAQFLQLYMEVFEEQAIESTAQKPKTWKHYVDNTFTIQDCNYINCFLQHLNSYQPNIQFTLEIGKGNKIAFLDNCQLWRNQTDAWTPVSIQKTNSHWSVLTSSVWFILPSISKAWYCHMFIWPGKVSHDKTINHLRGKETFVICSFL